MPRIKLDHRRVQEQVAARRESLARGISRAINSEPHHKFSHHEVLLRSGSMKLLRFEPTRSPSTTSPVLICYALVNRPRILDLSPDRSMVRGLLDAGIPVYLIDWGYPVRSDCHMTLDDYLSDLLDRSVDCVRRDSGYEKINLMGVCQGGILSVCYSLLFPQKIRNLITLVTPIDCAHKTFRLNQLSRYIDVQLAAATYGNVPGSLLNDLFTALQPMRLGPGKRLDAGQQLDFHDAQHYLLMEEWLQDCPDLAGAAMTEFIQLFFRENALMSPTGFNLTGKSVNTGELRMPVLNIYGNRDTLVPPQTSAALGQRLKGRDYEECILDAGHIGMLNGRRALADLPATISRWLRARS